MLQQSVTVARAIVALVKKRKVNNNPKQSRVKHLSSSSSSTQIQHLRESLRGKLASRLRGVKIVNVDVDVEEDDSNKANVKLKRRKDNRNMKCALRATTTRRGTTLQAMSTFVGLRNPVVNPVADVVTRLGVNPMVHQGITIDVSLATNRILDDNLVVETNKTPVDNLVVLLANHASHVSRLTSLSKSLSRALQMELCLSETCESTRKNVPKPMLPLKALQLISSWTA